MILALMMTQLEEDSDATVDYGDDHDPSTMYYERSVLELTRCAHDDSWENCLYATEGPVYDFDHGVLYHFENSPAHADVLEIAFDRASDWLVTDKA